MNEWRRVPDEDIELSEDGETVDVLISTNDAGDVYIEIPVSVLRDILDNAGCMYCGQPTDKKYLTHRWPRTKK